jgi:hypothetical protein
MLEVIGDIWDYHKQDKPIVITTNRTINAKNEIVMGRGVALQAKQKFPDLPRQLAIRIKNLGHDTVFWFFNYHLFTFPVKHNWFEKADIQLIEKSAYDLVAFVNTLSRENPSYFSKIYMVRPGCSNGKLTWDYVKPKIKNLLDDRFVIVQI